MKIGILKASLVTQQLRIHLNAGDTSSIPGSGRSPEEEKGKPLQYSCLVIPLDRGTWWATVYGVARVRYNLMTKPLLDIFNEAMKFTHHTL